MLKRVSLVLVLAAASAVALVGQSPAYFPKAGEWRKAAPETAGLDPAKLAEAVKFSIENENPGNKDLAVQIPLDFRNEAPYNTVDGPTQVRAGASGIIIRNGSVVAEWGDTNRADMTFSVTKTFLSAVVGVAYDRGLIKNVTDRAGAYMPKDVDLFTSEKNAPITWEHLLRQTSDWSGTLFNQPDWADRPAGQSPEQWPNRVMHAPGTFYKYNDTRVNVLALAALHVFKKPLPEVLKASIMDPIGASNTWRWEPYTNAYVNIDGKRMPSVPGGGHHGGGMFISAWDMARFGYLFLQKGKWNGKQLISEKWIEMSRSPGPVNNQYGYMNFFLNTKDAVVNGRPGRQMYPAAPVTAVAFRGNGENIVLVDWEHDMVAVFRWIRGANGFVDRLMASVVK
jgi:CubicO group peptidase (beta-lactamase class C family)